jgi:hypothetical protein
MAQEEEGRPARTLTFSPPSCGSGHVPAAGPLPAIASGSACRARAGAGAGSSAGAGSVVPVPVPVAAAGGSHWMCSRATTRLLTRPEESSCPTCIQPPPPPPCVGPNDDHDRNTPSQHRYREPRSVHARAGQSEQRSLCPAALPIPSMPSPRPGAVWRPPPRQTPALDLRMRRPLRFSQPANQPWRGTRHGRTISRRGHAVVAIVSRLQRNAEHARHLDYVRLDAADDLPILVPQVPLGHHLASLHLSQIPAPPTPTDRQAVC